MCFANTRLQSIKCKILGVVICGINNRHLEKQQKNENKLRQH